MKNNFQTYDLSNFRQIPQTAKLTPRQLRDIEVVGRVFPFRTNSYVVNELINWDNIPEDPMYTLTMPQRGMLYKHHYYQMAKLLRDNAPGAVMGAASRRIRMQLNPHPAGQTDNVPTFEGRDLQGCQHKYRETVLFFPSEGQSCFAYCTFCFRWPQFVGHGDMTFSSSRIDELLKYLGQHPEVTALLFTGGDPMTMPAEVLAQYVDRLLKADLPHLKTIRFGTKTLTYWPYRFINDPDSEALLDVLRRIVDSGRHVALMAHFNHPVEFSTDAAREAIARIRATGAEIRTQSPLLRHINDDPSVWSAMWSEQVRLGMVPYYMFVVRDTGAQHFFGVPLVKAWEIYRDAFSNVSGVARTVRGPSMSSNPGKVLVSGVAEAFGRKVIVLSMIQGRDKDWVGRPFFAEYDREAMWLDDLKPAFARRFFFEENSTPAMKMLFSG